MRHWDETETFILLQRSPPPSNFTLEKGDFAILQYTIQNSRSFCA